MHSLQEILLETRKNSNLCCAVERGGIICFKEKQKRDKYCGMHRRRLYKHGAFELPIRPIKRCMFIDCKNPYERGGYCKNHYQNKWSSARRNNTNNDLLKCIVESCKNKNYVKGYCNKHYIKHRRHGDAEYKQKKNNGKTHPNVLGRRKYKGCIATGCNITSEKPNSIVKGLCYRHYNRWRKWGDYNIASKKEYLEKLNK